MNAVMSDTMMKPNRYAPPPACDRQNHLAGRLDNWRRVVSGPLTRAASCCALWARWYVSSRVGEAMPAEDLAELKAQPVRPLVSADQLDGWMIEAAWRTLGDYNERMALKAKYIYRMPDERIRLKLKGVRGSHVKLVVARAERNLLAVLERAAI